MYVFALSIRFKVAIISVARAKGEDNILAVWDIFDVMCSMYRYAIMFLSGK